VETNPHRWIAALRHSQDRLASVAQPLTPEQLRGPSYHSWTIAQVLGHLGSQAEIFTAWLTAAVEGTEPPGREFMQPIWDAWNGRSPEEQAADSIADNERLVERFEGLTDDHLARMHLNLFGMELDAAGLLRLRLAEHALHTWDIAVALDPTARVAPDAVALLIDTLGFLADRVGQPQGRAFRLRVRTSEPERYLSLRVGDEVELTEWEDGSADGELRIPGEAFLRLVYGRLDPEHSPDVELTGAVALDDLRGVFPGV
jgi:uncharacterized protein (TIGR03083 family)